MNADRAAMAMDAFREAERVNLRAWMKLSVGQKVDFFEEMVELAYHSGELSPQRLALRDAKHAPACGNGGVGAGGAG